MQLTEAIFNNSIMRNIGGKWMRILHEDQYAEIRKCTGESRRRIIDMTALQNGIIPDVFVGFFIDGATFNTQMRLLSSKVVIIGLDVIGQHIGYSLARHGVGTVVAIDEDPSLGEEMRKHVNFAYTGTTFEFIHSDMDKNSMKKLIPPDTNLVISGIISTEVKFAIQQQCRELGIPFICLMISETAAVMVPIFPDTADITGRFDGFSDGVNPDDLDKRHRSNINQYCFQEALKLLTYGMSHIRGGMLFFDLRSGLISLMNM